MYEHSPGEEIRNLVPPLGAMFEEIFEDDEVAAEARERVKSFTMSFHAKWILEVKFTLEKKRVNNNLVDFAAEKVARFLKKWIISRAWKYHPLFLRKFMRSALISNG